MTNNSDSSAPNSPEATRLSGEQAEERTAREIRERAEAATSTLNRAQAWLEGYCKNWGNGYVKAVHENGAIWFLRNDGTLLRTAELLDAYAESRISETPAQSSEARRGVGGVGKSHAADEKGLASRVEELENLIAKHSGSLNSADSASNTESSSTAKEIR